MDAKGEEEKEEGEKKEGKMFCHRQPQQTFVKLIKLNLAKLKSKGEEEGKKKEWKTLCHQSTETPLFVILLLCQPRKVKNEPESNCIFYCVTIEGREGE